MTDVHELEKGMDLVRKEQDLRSGREKHNVVLRDFLSNADDKLRRLRADAKVAQDSFKDCVEYFGESPSTIDANSFFSLLVRFARAFKVGQANLVCRLRSQLIWFSLLPGVFYRITQPTYSCHCFTKLLYCVQEIRFK